MTKLQKVKAFAIIATEGYGKSGGGIEVICLSKEEVGKWVVENAGVSCSVIPVVILIHKK